MTVAEQDTTIQPNGQPVTNSERMTTALEKLRQHGLDGLTAMELGILTRNHHGKASGTLSVLHKEGRVVLLDSKRKGYGIYVLPTLVFGRATVARQSRKTAAQWRAEMAEATQAAYDKGWLQGVDDAEAPVTVYRQPALV